MPSGRRVVFVALLLCTASIASAGVPPQFQYFYADRTEVVRNQRVELFWAVSGAQQVELSPVGLVRTAGWGTWYFWADQTQTYVLTATNAYGTSTAEVTVTVAKQFDIVSFTVSDDLVGTQDAVVVSWDVFGVGEVLLDGEGPMPMSGSITDIPHNTHTYVLEVRSGDEFQTASAHVEVTGEWRRSRFLLSYSDDAIVTEPDGLFPFTTIPIYVLGESLDGFGLTGVEFGLNLTPELVLMDVDFHSYRAVNVLSAPDFVVGLGTCFQTDPLHDIAELTIMAMTQKAIDDGSLHLRPAAIPSVPGTVAYATCEFDLEGSEINHPLSSALIGPALYLSADRVPVVRMNLRAERQESVVFLRWDAVAVDGADRYRITRRVGSGIEREVGHGDVRQLLEELQFVDWDAPYGTLEYALSVWSGETLLLHESAKLDDGARSRDRSSLAQNTPNPFNPSTTLHWRAAVPGSYQLRVLSAAGRLVREFSFAIGTPGAQETQWDGRDATGVAAASGVYHVQLLAPDGRDQLRVVLLK